jgi:hypothetical protein
LVFTFQPRAMNLGSKPLAPIILISYTAILPNMVMGSVLIELKRISIAPPPGLHFGQRLPPSVAACRIPVTT